VYFFFIKIYLQDVNTYISVPESIKLFLANQFTCRTLAVRGVTVLPRQVNGRYSSEKIGTKEKTLQQKGMRCMSVSEADRMGQKCVWSGVVWYVRLSRWKPKI
jgi:hypothetical protein